MYINLAYIKDKGITLESVMQLQLLHQSRIEDIGEALDYFPTYKSIDSKYIQYLKDGSPRLSKLGKEVLDTLQIPNATENHIALADYLIDKYKEDGDKILCSKNKLVELIAWFCAEVGLTARELYNLILLYFETDDSIYNKRLDYLFFRPVNAYAKKNLNESRLYLWYENNKDNISLPKR